MNLIKTLKPGVPKRILLFSAAIVWTFAGCMLLYRGISLAAYPDPHWITRTGLSLGFGILFYGLLFDGISAKHTLRIMELPYEKPCVFSFFNFRGYILMAVMIASGILLRRSGIASKSTISVIYITMGIPLLLSSLRFYYTWIFYKRIRNKLNRKPVAL